MHNSDYTNGRTGSVNNVAGLVDEVGAAATSATVSADITIVTLRLRALQSGTSSITANAVQTNIPIGDAPAIDSAFATTTD